ncbi:MAG: replication initiator protein A [Thermoguttaceae bacterium]|jgi:hypothetical protein
MEQRFSIPETALGDVHLKSMGKDEMNLVEFPLTTLADRAPRGCKTLVFEDRIWDRGSNQERIRRLTVSASDKYGLPTAIDDEVILGLLQLSKAAGFADRRVRFSRYQLLRVLGWQDEGRSYRRLERSLKRWLGVTLYYDSAWWDVAQQRWVDAHFHLLDDLVLYQRPKPHANSLGKGGDSAISSFTWNEIVFDSFRVGYLKDIDLDFYRCLKLAASKRMYRFLDKRFYRGNVLRFRLPVFACEHVGLSRRYDTAQLKRRLNPAIEELERAGFLSPMPPRERFRRLRRGEWEVVLVRAAQARKRGQPAGRLSDLENRLVERGVTATSAVRLVREHPADVIHAKLAVFDQLRKTGDRRVSRNPAGYLVKSIREDYAPPVGFLARACRPSSETVIAGRGVVKNEVGQDAATIYASESDRKIEQYLAALSAEERSGLEEAAVTKARGFAAKGLQRLITEGKQDVADYYRMAILRQHVQRLLEQQAAA